MTPSIWKNIIKNKYFIEINKNNLSEKYKIWDNHVTEQLHYSIRKKQQNNYNVNK